MRQLWVPAVALALAAHTALGGEDEASRVKESQIKAAFLYNFTKFVEWPDGSLGDANAPIVIGVLGQSAILDELEAIVAERRVNGRPIEVTNVDGQAGAARVHLLFVTAPVIEEFLAVREAIRDVPVLTVGESPAFAAGTGVIGFVQLSTKVRFEIDMAAAQRARLKISGELQKLATSIRRSPGQ